MKSVYDIILSPVLTEKSYEGIPNKRYTFIVQPTATKTQIKVAIEKIYGVKVAAVNTSIREGKVRRQGRTQGRTPTLKKAIVTLKQDSKAIEFFEGMAQ